MDATLVTIAMATAPPVLCVANIYIEDRVDARNEKAKRASAQAIQLRVEGPGRISLGSSIESSDSISGTPTLTTQDLMLVGAQGGRFRLPAGQKLTILKLAGAERPLLRTVTTDSGVEQHYGFTISPEQPFWLVAAKPAAPAGAGPFRDAPVELLPQDGGFEVSSENSSSPAAPSSSSATLSKFVGTPLALLASATAAFRFAQWLWWVLMVAGGLWLFVLFLNANLVSKPSS